MEVQEECLKLLMEKYRTKSMSFLASRTQRLEAMEKYLESTKELDDIASQIRKLTQTYHLGEEILKEAKNLILMKVS